MAEDTRRGLGGRGLGRGLSALLGDGEPDQQAPGTAAPKEDGSPRQRTLPVAFLKPNRFQPRRVFRDEDLRDLANSVREKGILQPILVRPTGTPDAYEIVAGERRWRAAQLAQLHDVPVVIRTLSDAESLEIAIIENVQRADLNPIEEAMAYRELIEAFGHTQEQLSELIGKSRSHIANTLRLLKLPDAVQGMVGEGRLTAGHARTLIGVPDAEKRAAAMIAGELNVRQAEQQRSKPVSTPSKPALKDADTKALEQSITNALGLKVQIAHRGDKGGDVVISYKTLEQLDDVCRRLSTFGEID